MAFLEQDHAADGIESVKRAFSPEFRNRLDSIIRFKPLSFDVIKHVVDKLICELQAQLDDKGILLDIDEEARGWLAEHGYDQKMGARPMSRLIQNVLKRPLAEELLFGKLSHGGAVHITQKEGELCLDFQEEKV